MPPSLPSLHDAPPGGRADSLGCAASSLSVSRELSCGEVSFYRKRYDSPLPSRVETAASDRGFLLGVSLAPGHRRRVLHGRGARTCELPRGAHYLRDFADDYRADICTRFDFLLVEFPADYFERLTQQAHGGRPECSLARQDEVLAHLAQAVLPAIEHPLPGQALFVEQMGVAMGLHLAGMRRAAASVPAARLSRVQLAIATELLLGDATGPASLAAIAEACALSRGYFIRAFRNSVGATPHQWLMRQRIERVRALLIASDRTLADIAADTGFADQSHLTRVFTRMVGMAPGAWRRGARGV